MVSLAKILELAERAKRSAPAKASPASVESTPAPPGLSIEQILAAAEKAKAKAPAKRTSSRRARLQPVSVDMPAYMVPHFERAVESVARRADVRPSFVLAELNKLFQAERKREVKRGKVIAPYRPAGRLHAAHPDAHAWLQLYPARVLQAARARLPGQPQTPLKRPPKKRRVKRSVAGVLGIIGAGSDQLVDRPVAAEAFTGGGLFSIALLAEGVYENEVCEMDPNAVATLKLNLHEEAESTDALQWNPEVPGGGLDILCGGPPCQSFSPARYLGSPGLGVNSGDNMYPRVLDWIADTQPRVVLMENSAAVATGKTKATETWTIPAPGEQSDKGARDFFRAWWKNIDELGYEGVYWLLYAPSFGTPQNRLRAWVVCWPKGAPWGKQLREAPSPTHGHPLSREVREGKLLPWSSAFDRLVSGCCGGYGLVECIALNNLSNACLTCIDGSNFEQAPNTTGSQGRVALSSKAKDSFAEMANERQSRLRKYPPIDLSAFSAFRPRQSIENLARKVRVTDWLSKAVVAHFGKDDKTSAFVPEDIPADVYSLRESDRYRDRRRFTEYLQRISVRESAKLQDVPQWWAFGWDPSVATTDAKQRQAVFRQIGNGIPVNMGRAAVRKVVSALGYPTPIPGSVASDPNEGFWSDDLVDSCQRFRAPFAYPGALWDTVAHQRMVAGDQGRRPRLPVKVDDQILPQDRIARPASDIKAFRGFQRDREAQLQRRRYWHDPYLDGVETYNWEATAGKRLSGFPPGFGGSQHYESSWDLFTELERVDQATINHILMAYAEGATGNPMDVKAGMKALSAVLGPDIELDFRFQRSEGVPSWSQYRRVLGKR